MTVDNGPCESMGTRVIAKTKHPATNTKNSITVFPDVFIKPLYLGNVGVASENTSFSETP
jgi:hypothetical protein